MRLRDECAGAVVCGVAEIRGTEPVNDIAGSDSEMACTPEVKAESTGNLKLAIDSEIPLGHPNAVDSCTKLAVSKKFAGPNFDIRIKLRMR